MRELTFNELCSIDGGLEKCEMSTATKVEIAVIFAVSPLMGVAAIASYYSKRDC